MFLAQPLLLTPSLPLPNELFELLMPSTCRARPVMSPADVTTVEEQAHTSVSLPSCTWPNAQVYTPSPTAVECGGSVGSPEVADGTQVGAAGGSSELDLGKGTCLLLGPPGGQGERLHSSSSHPVDGSKELGSQSVSSMHSCPDAVSLNSGSCLARTLGGTRRKRSVTGEHFFSLFFCHGWLGPCTKCLASVKPYLQGDSYPPFSLYTSRSHWSLLFWSP